MFRKVAGRLGAVALASVAIACSSATQLDGSLAVRGSPAYGDWEGAAESCAHDQSGTVTLGAAGHEVLVTDGTVTLYSTDGQSAPDAISGDNCTTFAVSVTPGGDGSGYYLDGQVLASCALPGGGTFDADVTFTNCPCTDCQCAGCANSDPSTSGDSAEGLRGHVGLAAPATHVR